MLFSGIENHSLHPKCKPSLSRNFRIKSSLSKPCITVGRATLPVTVSWGDTLAAALTESVVKSGKCGMKHNRKCAKCWRKLPCGMQ